MFLVAVADEAKRVVDLLALLEGPRVPGTDDFRVIAGFKRLDPGGLDLRALDGRLATAASGAVGEVRGVGTRAAGLEEQRDLRFGQRPRPDANARNVSLRELTAEVRSRAAHLEDEVRRVRLGEAVPLGDHPAIQPEPRRAAADGEHRGVGFAVVDRRAAGDLVEPADVINQPPFADEQGLRACRPMVFRGALGEEGAVRFGFEVHHGGEVRAKVEPGLREIRCGPAGHAVDFLRAAHQLAARPDAQHRLALRRVLERDVVLQRFGKRDDEVIAQAHLRFARLGELDVKTVVLRPFRTAQRNGVTGGRCLERGRRQEKCRRQMERRGADGGCFHSRVKSRRSFFDMDWEPCF